MLHLLRSRLGCGRIRPNARAGGRDKSLVYVVRKLGDLNEKVVPFFESHPLLSEKQSEFVVFASIVRAMSSKKHLTEEGFHQLLLRAVAMNGGGRYRREDWLSKILRGHTPDTELSVKIWSDPHGDMGSQAESKRPGRRDRQLKLNLGGNRSVGPYPPRA
jgi:hypothetical protein